MQTEELTKLPPWLRHVIVAMVERQQLVDELRLIITTQLPADGDDAADVPGRPGWTYQRMFKGWFVTHAASGLSLSLETKSQAQAEEPFMLFSWIEQGRGAQTEASLRCVTAFRRAAPWLLGYSLVCHALSELHELGALSNIGTSYALSPSLQQALSDSDRRALRAADSRDESKLGEWRSWLAQCAADPTHGALRDAHVELDDEEVERLVWKFLQAPDFATSTALDVATQRQLEIPPAIVNMLLRDIDVVGADQYGTTLLTLAKFAFDQGVAEELAVDRLVKYATTALPDRQDYAEGLDDEMRELLRGVDTTSAEVHGLAEIAALLLEHSPTDAMVAVRRALREDTVGGLLLSTRLVAIGQPWAIREIEAAIGDVVPMMGHSMIAALRSRGFHDAAARARVLDPTGVMDDMMDEMLSITAGLMNQEEVLDNLSAWAEKVRAGLPEGFDPS